MNNKRGLSAVIVTLLLVMLSIVLVGVVFVVVQNVVKTGTTQAQQGFTCTSNGVEVTYATCNYVGTSCNVTVKRTQGSDTMGGVTLAFSNAAGDAGSNITMVNIIAPTQSRLNNVTVIPAVSNITTIQASIDFVDNQSGKISSCPGQTSFTNVGLVP